MRKILILCGILGVGYAYAQNGKVGINIDMPEATLHIKPNNGNAKETATTNEGLIIPKLSKQRVSIIADNLLKEGTLVYVDNMSYIGNNSKVVKITEKGYYYYNGTEWQKIGAGSYIGSASVRLNGESFEREALTGDVTAKVNSNETIIANNAVTSAKIENKTILAEDLNKMNARDGYFLIWNEERNTWEPRRGVSRVPFHCGSTSGIGKRYEYALPEGRISCNDKTGEVGYYDEYDIMGFLDIIPSRGSRVEFDLKNNEISEKLMLIHKYEPKQLNTEGNFVIQSYGRSASGNDIKINFNGPSSNILGDNSNTYMIFINPYKEYVNKQYIIVRVNASWNYPMYYHAFDIHGD